VRTFTLFILSSVLISVSGFASALPFIDIEIGGGRNTLKGATEEAYVTWTGGPDLGVIYFIPPVILSENRKVIRIQDFTANIGSVTASDSVTRYYLSDVEPPFDITMARIVGERSVASIEPDGESRGEEIVVPFPDDLGPGMYYLAACADADSTVVELDEENNCSYTNLNSSRQYTVVAAIPSPNQPPDCTLASTSINKLWPPNHKMSPVNINGITDPDDDPVSIIVTSIQQDEPVNDLGDGNTNPDGSGIGTSTAKLRAERSGTGNGRVYIVGFTASDDKEANCSGFITVGVPHDKGGKVTPIDSGDRYDSTIP
jgi:hypothetical protein